MMDEAQKDYLWSLLRTNYERMKTLAAREEARARTGVSGEDLSPLYWYLVEEVDRILKKLEELNREKP
ncbi:MAG: hypothetical protein KIS81_08220 [Maricaulaceae bacterium]|nr:hypothetical protein [Maricaulaceae bacterium]